MISFGVELCDPSKQFHCLRWHTALAFHQVLKVNRREYERVSLHQSHHLSQDYASSDTWRKPARPLNRSHSLHAPKQVPAGRVKTSSTWSTSGGAHPGA